jgi:N-acetylneuraminic acid mutarotase
LSNTYSKICNRIESVEAVEEVKVEVCPSAQSYWYLYRLNGQLLVKHHYTGKSQTIYTLQDSYHMPKLVQVSETKLYAIGGSSDIKGSNPINNCLFFDYSGQKPLRTVEMASMNSVRFGHGICLSQDRKRIYVCGGYGEGKTLTSTCEYYDILKNEWIKLSDLNAAKASVGVCEFTASSNDRCLYAFGGVKKSEASSGPELLDTVEKAHVSGNFTSHWQVLSFKLPHPIIDIGCFQVSEDKIILMGGWRKENNFVEDCIVVQVDARKNLAQTQTAKMDHHDYFMGGGPAITLKDNQLFFLGQIRQHILSLPAMTFKSEPLAKI